MDISHATRCTLRSLAAAAFLVLFSGCYANVDPNAVLAGNANAGTGPAEQSDPNGGAAGDSDMPANNGADAGETSTLVACSPVSGEPLPQRSSILSNTVVPTEREVYIDDIWTLFSSQCKGCHIDQAQGAFQVSKKNFPSLLRDPKVLQRLTSDDLTFVMPPIPAKAYTARIDGDPVRDLVRLLTEWGTAGYPPDLFVEQLTSTAQSPYALSKATGNAFTNIGTCLPELRSAFASDTKTMTALDADFAARKANPVAAEPEDQIGLPLDLADTDFTSFDSGVLARRGVIAFAPAYPLWSDDAGKLRYVRVPVGKSIVFDAKTQHFDIPDNTRFYKTFLKQVTDASGKQRWRKMETRLIVARKETLPTSDVNYAPQSLFGSYRWDETETHATLLRDALRNGQPFADDIVNYIADEPQAEAIRATNPANLTYALEFKNIIRHWAIPGSKRCIHCHEGSSNGDFILGFTPLQINRRPLGEGGVYEAPEPDELTQLQRLIDLGVISGIKSPSEVTKLEDSQRDRIGEQGVATVPRSDLELRAQAYLLANCAHCHNPNGFPSVANKELIPLLNFYPSATGGVFQFPLERYSPRITRGFDNSQIAYITPSMRDLIPSGSFDDGTTKYVAKYGNLDPNSPNGVPFFNAPWRSLIYRNTQTPFTYGEAYTLYPHMPFDTAGHDCRAGQWLGEWMVSIPAVRKHPEIFENATSALLEDTEPQPYTEVLPGSTGYDAAVTAANKRLDTYRKDPRYSMCPDNSDIFDPDVTAGRYPTPRDTNNDGVPDHPNWVVTDLTEFAGVWQPRRTDWQKVLVKDPPQVPPIPNDDGTQLAAQLGIVDQLHSVKLSDVTDKTDRYPSGFANTPFPMGIWLQKDGCRFDSPNIDTVSSQKFTGDARPAWFDQAMPAPTAPVFSVLPGQAIFDMICINCHGQNADSLGRQADTLQNLTGGVARVANFRFGLFNPSLVDDPYDKPDLGPQYNRVRVFGASATPSISADDWGARYLAWMALGGTGVQIPQDILSQVARTEVLGVARPLPLAPYRGLSANMLQSAQVACRETWGWQQHFRLEDRRTLDRAKTPLIISNGDAELWQTVCSMNNQPLVHQIRFADADLTTKVLLGARAVVKPLFTPATPCDPVTQLPAGCYPADALVGDQHGHIVRGLSADNTYPWCLDRTNLDPAVLEAFANANSVAGNPLPICPSTWVPAEDDGVNWQNRGAINAGLCVFQFLDQFIKGQITHLTYDQCDQLP